MCIKLQELHHLQMFLFLFCVMYVTYLIYLYGKVFILSVYIIVHVVEYKLAYNNRIINNLCIKLKARSCILCYFKRSNEYASCITIIISMFLTCTDIVSTFPFFRVMCNYYNNIPNITSINKYSYLCAVSQ